jgi:hypothetical protein
LFERERAVYSSIQVGPSIERIDPAGLSCPTIKGIDQAGLNITMPVANAVKAVFIKASLTSDYLVSAISSS